MVNTEEIFLSQAIAKAWESQTLALPNPSVGALILSSDFKILALEAHDEFGSAHAELRACKEAFLNLTSSSQSLRDRLDLMSPQELWDFLALNHQNLFRDCLFFVTLEPCNHRGKTPSCAKLLSILKPKKVIFGARDLTNKAQGGAEFLRSCGIEVEAEVCLQESLNLLYPFLKFEEKGRFNLFKLAMRLNGGYQNGQISNHTSRIFTHTQRSNADSLIISGKTIRTDSPRLDTRYSRRVGKTPKIQVLSKTPTQLDCICAKEIEVFQDPLKLCLNQGFNVIEGGYPLLMELSSKIDALLLIIAPFFEGRNVGEIERMDFELLFSQVFLDEDRDVALWLKPKNHA